jgi:hypothetical protein
VLIETFHRPLDRALQGVTKDDASGGSINYKVKINNPKRALKNSKAASWEKKDSCPKKPRIFNPEVHVVKILKNQDSGSETGSLSDKSTATKIALTKNAIFDALKEGVISKAEIRKAMGWSDEVGCDILLLWLYLVESNFSSNFIQVLLENDEADEYRNDGNSFEDVRFHDRCI